MTGPNDAEIIATTLLNELIENVLTVKAPNCNDDLFIDLSTTCALDIFNTLDSGFDLTRGFNEIQSNSTQHSLPVPITLPSHLQTQNILSPNLLNDPVKHIQTVHFTGSKELKKIRPQPMLKQSPLFTRATINKHKLAQATIEAENVVIPCIDYSIPKVRIRKQQLIPMDVGNYTIPRDPPKKRGRKRKNYGESFENDELVLNETENQSLNNVLKAKAKDLIANFTCDVENAQDTELLVDKTTNFQCTYCKKYFKNTRTLANHIKICPKFRFEITEFIDNLYIKPKVDKMEVELTDLPSKPLTQTRSNTSVDQEEKTCLDETKNKKLEAFKEEPTCLDEIQNENLEKTNLETYEDSKELIEKPNVLNELEKIEQQLAKMDSFSIPEQNSSSNNPNLTNSGIQKDFDVESEKLVKVVRVMKSSNEPKLNKMKRKRGRPRKLNSSALVTTSKSCSLRNISHTIPVKYEDEPVFVQLRRETRSSNRSKKLKVLQVKTR